MEIVFPFSATTVLAPIVKEPLLEPSAVLLPTLMVPALSIVPPL